MRYEAVALLAVSAMLMSLDANAQSQLPAPGIPGQGGTDCTATPTLRYARSLLSSTNRRVFQDGQAALQVGLQEQFQCEQANARREHETRIAQLEIERLRLAADRRTCPEAK